MVILETYPSYNYRRAYALSLPVGSLCIMLWCNRPSDMRTSISHAPAETLENGAGQSRFVLDCFPNRTPNPEYGPTHSETPRLPPVLFDDFPLDQKSQPAIPPQVHVRSTFKCSSPSSSIASSPACSLVESSSLTSHPSSSTICSSPSKSSTYSIPKVPQIPARFEAQFQHRKETVSVEPEILSPISKAKARSPLQEFCQEPSTAVSDETKLNM